MKRGKGIDFGRINMVIEGIENPELAKLTPLTVSPPSPSVGVKGGGGGDRRAAEEA